MKQVIISLFVFCTFSVQSQNLNDTTYVPNIYLDEVIVFGEKKVKATKLGYLNKENFTFSLYQNYEIGVFIKNTHEYSKINDVYLTVNNELTDECDIEINFYEFSSKPGKLIGTVNGKVIPSNRKKQIIASSDNIDIEFPKDGIFISTRIKSRLTKQDKQHFRVYLSEKYESKSTFIRGSIYGDSWTEFSNLNIRNSKNVNVCYGIFATK